MGKIYSHLQEGSSQVCFILRGWQGASFVFHWGICKKRGHMSWLANLEIFKHIHALIAIESNRIWNRNRGVMSGYWPAGGRGRGYSHAASSFFLFLHLLILCLPLWKQICGDKWPGRPWLWRCCELWRWEGFICMPHLIVIHPGNARETTPFHSLLQTVNFLLCGDLVIEFWTCSVPETWYLCRVRGDGVPLGGIHFSP